MLGIVEPDVTVLLDLEPRIALGRARRRNEADGSVLDEGRFEAEELPFHHRVREGYLELSRLFPERIRVIPAHGSPDDVFRRIVPLLDEWTAGLNVP